MLKQYETVFIATPVLSEQQMKEAVAKYTKLIADNGGEVVYEEDWGLRQLAYPIQHKTSGFYYLIQRMSDTLPGLTETSTNMAIVRTQKGHLTVHSLTRSSIDAAKMYLADSIRYVFELAGAEYSMSGAYSGWAPKLGTPMIKVLEDTFKSLFGKELKITATHGGLECAIMGAI